MLQFILCATAALSLSGSPAQVTDGEVQITISQPASTRGPCLTGTCRDTLDVFAGPLSDRPVQAVWTGETSGTVYGYTVSGYAPKSLEVLQVQWWDGYGFAGHWGVPALTDDRVRRTAGPGEGGLWEMSPESAPDSLYAGAQGLPTGSLSKVLGTLSGNQYLWGVRYHDGRGREVQSVRQTLRGVEKEETAYGFTDEVLRRTLTHTGADGNTVMTERYTYTYDGWGRPLTVVHAVDGAAPVTLHAYTYDGVGRLAGDARNGTPALGTSCSYNVRSWTTSLETGASGSTFAERLSYCGAEGTGTAPSHPRWGGDVGAQSWRAGRDGMIRRYDYAYDGAGRLAEAAYTATSGGSRYDRGYAYDRNGNVTQVTGLSAGSYAAGGISTVSSLWYDGNRLTSEVNAATLLAEPVLLDAAPATAVQSASAAEPAASPADGGVGTPAIDDNVPLGSVVTKTYDRVGRLVRDGDTHLSKVSYNHLGLPSRVTFLPQGGVTPDPLGLQYAADGRKLREGRLVSAKRPALSQGVSTQSSWAVVGATLMERFDAPTDYSGNLVYKSGVLDKVLFDGGYISAADTSYHFFITDHQGNVRVVADASGAVEQVTHYGPFGEDLGDSAASLPVGAQDSVGNPYKYGGKEWDSALGLYDFSARLYRPAAARFTTMDPLCEKYYSISPYAYCANNPVNLVDPSGMDNYFISADGFISMIGDPTDDDFDVLYSNKEDGGIDYGKYIKITNRSLLPSLARTYKETAKDDMGRQREFDASSAQSEQSGQIFNIFKFVSENSSVEWVVHKTSDGTYTLGTLHYPEGTGAANNYGIEETPQATVHSHPGTKYVDQNEAVKSMGYDDNIVWGDRANVVHDYNRNHRITRASYVFFPVTGYLYYVDVYRPVFVRRISSPGQFSTGRLR